MNKITAKIILDSTTKEDIRLTTLHVHMPRIVLAEINTHRAFSRNSRSTRAVPTSKLIQEVRNSPYVPVRWGLNQPGMSAAGDAFDHTAAYMEKVWLEAANNAANSAEELFKLGLHKQWAGRLLEPFMWTDALISATDWANYFSLRIEKGAQDEIYIVAEKIKEALDNSTPKTLEPGEWHMPYIMSDDYVEIQNYLYLNGKYNGHKSMIPKGDIVEVMKKVSTARCARVTHKPFDGDGSIAKEIDRFEKLMVSRPVHASPAEMVATPDVACYGWHDATKQIRFHKPELHGNYTGWIQYRKTIPYNTIYDR